MVEIIYLPGSHEPENGGIDEEYIDATISLPAKLWERMTADLRDFDRDSGDPWLPDTSLEHRIDLFLTCMIAGWRETAGDDVSDQAADPDDDPPF